MTVYVLHIFGRLSGRRSDARHDDHYIGFTVRPTASYRVWLHRKGRSRSKYMQQVVREGLRFYLVNEYPGADRDFERALKNRHNAWRFCNWCKRKRERAQARAKDKRQRSRTNRRGTSSPSSARRASARRSTSVAGTSSCTPSLACIETTCQAGASTSDMVGGVTRID